MSGEREDGGVRSRPTPDLVRGTGAAGGDDYSVRLARLESDVAALNGLLKDVKETLRITSSFVLNSMQKVNVVEKELRQKPSTTLVATMAFGIFALFVALVLFQNEIKQILGLWMHGK